VSGTSVRSSAPVELTEVPETLAVIGAGYIGLELGIAFALRVDGLNLLPLALTTFLFLISVLHCFVRAPARPPQYLACLLLLESALVGAFLAQDLVLFCLCSEFATIPAGTLIGLWGGRGGRTAAVRFVLFHCAGSVLLLVAVLMSAVMAGAPSLTFDLIALSERLDRQSVGDASWVFLAYALAFGIRIAMAPFHSWLADAHAESAPGVSIALLGVLHLAAYGFLRIPVALFPATARDLSPVLGSVAVASVMYAALLIMAERDLKRLVAFSSVASAGTIALGVLSGTATGMQGACVLIVGHGLAGCGLLLVAGSLRRRRRRVELDGLAASLPRAAAVVVICAMSLIGLPGLVGFVGELMVLVGTYGSPSVTLGVPTQKLATFVVALAGMLGVGAILLVILTLGRTDPPIPVGSTSKSVATAAVFALMAFLLFPPVDDFDGGLLMRPLSPYLEQNQPFSALMPALAVSATVAMVALAIAWTIALGRCWSRSDTGPVDAPRRGEGLLLVPVLTLLVFFGVYPKPLLDVVEPAMDAYATELKAAFSEPPLERRGP
ncbi:MAG: NADH-quinone oxidoreductase subunit M, partial [Myxococcota bacterium]